VNAYKISSGEKIMEKGSGRVFVNNQLQSLLNMHMSKKRPMYHIGLFYFIRVSIVIMSLLIIANPFNQGGFEESIKLDLDPDLMGTRQERFEKYDSGQISRTQYFDKARSLEQGSKRSKYIDEMFKDTELRVKTKDPKTGKVKKGLINPDTGKPFKEYFNPMTGKVYDEVPVFKRSGSPAATGRGILSDEDIMIDLRLGLSDKEMKEHYDNAIQKLNEKVKTRIDSLATQTVDDVVIWNPSRVMRKSIGGKDYYFIVGVQYNEYAPGAAAGGLKDLNLVGLQEEFILDNLNKGRTGFLQDPSSWLPGDKKMTHKIWDELRLAAKDAYRSLEVAGLDKGPLKETYERYMRLAKGEVMPSELGIYKKGALLEDRLKGARKEMEKMRKFMKKSLSVSRERTITQMDDLLKQIENATTRSQLEKLGKLTQEAGDRMHRIALNYEFLMKQPGSSVYMKQMGFPHGYLGQLNKMAARLRKVLDGSNSALVWFFIKNLPAGDDLNRTIKALMSGEDLPDVAKSLQKELAGVAGFQLVSLEKQGFMTKLKKDVPSLRLKPNDKSVHNLLNQMNTATEAQMARLFWGMRAKRG
jgi:hypothetical protein